jgi:hypothetical protein
MLLQLKFSGGSDQSTVDSPRSTDRFLDQGTNFLFRIYAYFQISHTKFYFSLFIGDGHFTFYSRSYQDIKSYQYRIR